MSQVSVSSLAPTNESTAVLQVIWDVGIVQNPLDEPVMGLLQLTAVTTNESNSDNENRVFFEMNTSTFPRDDRPGSVLNASVLQPVLNVNKSMIIVSFLHVPISA